jgi:hypothetical protein
MHCKKDLNPYSKTDFYSKNPFKKDDMDIL